MNGHGNIGAMRQTNNGRTDMGANGGGIHATGIGRRHGMGDEQHIGGRRNLGARACCGDDIGRNVSGVDGRLNFSEIGGEGHGPDGMRRLTTTAAAIGLGGSAMGFQTTGGARAIG